MELLQNWKLQVLLCLFSIVIIYHILPVLVYLVFLVLAGIGGVVLAVINQPGPYQRRDRESFPPPPASTLDVPLSRVKPYPPPPLKPKLLSPRIDACIQDLVSLTLEHHMVPTYKLVGWDHAPFFKSVTPHVWSVLRTLLQRVRRVDTMKLVSQDVVQLLRSHFENFRGLHYQDHVPQDKFPNLTRFPYLESHERELNFLRQACEVLLCVSLPRHLLECTPVRVLVREYLACRILQPTIDMLCDPDYINQKMLAHLAKREEALERTGKKTTIYKYKDFEEFMNQIKRCEDVEELQGLRQQIITDIIQAKAVYKMKHSHTTGLHGKQFPIPIPAEKLKILMGRDLELYIRQLGTAKTSCDRQLRKQGGEEYEEESALPLTGGGSGMEDSQEGERPLGIPFITIMSNDVALMFFLRFLEECGSAHLLCFWSAAENLTGETDPESQKSAVKKLHKDFLTPLSSGYIHVAPELTASVRDYVAEKGNVDLEACLRGMVGIQEAVFEELQEGFYQDFLWSEQYRELMHQNSTSNVEGAFNPLENLSIDPDTREESHHRQKLKSLKLQLEGKDNELSMMPPQVQASQSLSQRKRALQKDRSQLREEIKKLEHYLDHTEEWFDTVGQWSVEVHSVDLKEDDKNPLFIIIVHRPKTFANKEDHNANTGNIPDTSDTPDTGEITDDLTPALAWQHQQQHQQYQMESASTVDSEDAWSELSSGSEELGFMNRSGWVIGRRLSEFEDLHEKVTEICPNLYFPPLPKWLNPFQRPDANSAYWQKYRKALELYLTRVLKDERLKECEEVFNFVSSASDNLRTKPAAPHPERKRFSLPVIQSFPGMPRFGVTKDSQPDDGTSKELDSTAEYMYLLVSEIFELDHFSRVLRKQLVELVQLTYGKSIDREMQDMLNWVFSEPLLIFYLETFKESMWPGGKPAPPGATRSDEEKAETKERARAKFLKSSPQQLQTILGQRNCQIGMRKIFELLQDPRGNKQLFYALLEVLLYSLVTELEEVEIDDDTTDWKYA